MFLHCLDGDERRAQLEAILGDGAATLQREALLERIRSDLAPPDSSDAE